MSVDGYSATTKGELDWIPYDDEFEKFGEKIVRSVGSPLYGRVTYELMKGYWQSVMADPAAFSEHDRQHVKWLENVPKVVFSKTLMQPDWKNTQVISDDVAAEVAKLKAQAGQDLVIFGSPTLALSLMELGLIDEFQFTVSPVILGEGKTFMREVKKRTQLELLASETFKAGVIALRYKILR